MYYSSSSRSKSKDTAIATRHRPSPSMPPSSSSTFASSTSWGFSSRSSTFFARAVSPTRANPDAHHSRLHHAAAHSSSSFSPSVSFSFDHRPLSPGRSSISFTRQRTATASSNAVPFNQKRTCACSPTTHPGSFRCALHRGLGTIGNSRQATPYRGSCGGRLSFDYRRSAMKNSLVRIGGVEGELVKRALTTLIRPSSHHQRRRAAFEPRPSRLSKMSKAEDDL